MTNTQLLLKAIDDSGLKREAIASKLNISRVALQKKIINETEFKASEVSKLTKILELTTEKRDLIFLSDE